MKLFQDVQVKEKTDCILWYAKEESNEISVEMAASSRRRSRELAK